eukprot:TRINITY_DN12783_c0_g1_i1.p2 TRINITY_DN12783_c0_g1~~TRINITY_DN12783_c0_g1_i1.p2  ORF type:complete len:209 (+),score=31.99 TRINITY_DN12783_c0_g1_i1:362-988(+)
MEFLQELLCEDPAKRATAKSALTHKWLQAKIEEVIPERISPTDGTTITTPTINTTSTSATIWTQSSLSSRDSSSWDIDVNCLEESKAENEEDDDENEETMSNTPNTNPQRSRQLDKIQDLDSVRRRERESRIYIYPYMKETPRNIHIQVQLAFVSFPTQRNKEVKRMRALGSNHQRKKEINSSQPLFFFEIPEDQSTSHRQQAQQTSK